MRIHLSLSLMMTLVATSTSLSAQESDPFVSISQGLEGVRATYAAADKKVDQAEIDKTVDRLIQISGASILPAPLSEQDDTIVLRSTSDASTILRIDPRNGDVLFQLGFDRLRSDIHTPGLPSMESAAGAATDWLRELDMLPEGPIEVVHTGGLNLGVHGDDGSTKIFEKLRTVRFGREIDGLKVEGPGSRLIVHLGSNGELFGVIKRWQSFNATPIAASDRLSMTQIRSLAMLQLSLMSKRAIDRTIDQVELVLFDDGHGIMEPAIRVVSTLTFEGKTTDATTGREVKELYTNPLDFYIPVVKDTQARFPFVKDAELAVQPTPEIR